MIAGQLYDHQKTKKEKHIKANKIRQEQHVNDCKLQAKIRTESPNSVSAASSVSVSVHVPGRLSAGLLISGPGYLNFMSCPHGKYSHFVMSCDMCSIS